MNIYLKAVSYILIALILYIILQKEAKDYAVLLSLIVCCLIATVAMQYVAPILVFVRRLQTMGNFDESFLSILLKSLGVGLLTEIVSLVCIDAGNTAFSKILHILAVVTILWLGLPLFEALITLIEDIVVAI